MSDIPKSVGEILATAQRRVQESVELSMLREIARTVLTPVAPDQAGQMEIIPRAAIKKYQKAQALAETWRKQFDPNR